MVSRTYHHVILMRSICVMRVIHADPMNEYCGMTMRFPIIFRIAIEPLIHIMRDCSHLAIMI